VDQPGKYYLFSLSSFSPGAIPVAHGKLYYSVVDMNLQNKYGDVVDTLKNIFLDSMLSSAMIAIPGNNCDIWLLLHDARFPQFKAYHITAEGISDTPVVSTIGGMFFPTQSTNHSSMAVSPDRSKVVLTFMDGVSPSTGSPFGGAML